MEIRNSMVIKPGYKLDWLPIEGKEEILVGVIPDRAELAKRFMGLGAHHAKEREIVSELDEERKQEG